MIESKASRSELNEREDKDITNADKYSSELKIENNQYPTTTECALFIKVPQPFHSTALTPVNKIDAVPQAPKTLKISPSMKNPRNSLPDNISEISIPLERSPNDFVKYDEFKLNKLQKAGNNGQITMKKKDYHYLSLSKDVKSLGIHPKENLIVQLSRLGLPDETILAVAFGSDVETVEEAMDYIYKGELEDWDHKYVNKNKTEIEEKVCPTCIQNEQNEKIELKTTQIQIFPENERIVSFVRNGMTVKNIRCQLAMKKKDKLSQKNVTADNSQELISTTHDSIKPDLCVVCGDGMESHSPDFNIEKYKDFFSRQTPPVKINFNKRQKFENLRNISEQSISTHDNFGTPKVEEDEKVGDHCLICFENLLALPPFKKIITSQCGHKFCSSCMDHYMFLQIEKIKPEHFKCPVPTCNHIFPQEFVTSQVTLFQWFMYKIRQKEVEFLKVNKLIYCPACWDPVKIPDIDEPSTKKNTVTCRSCKSLLCKLCGTKEHGSLNCAENVSKYYSRLARGRNIQLCPFCKSVVKKSERSSHMYCGKCKSMFCFYCRKQKNQCNKEANYCKFSENEFRCCPENPPLSSLITRKKLSNWLMLIICMLLIIFSPLIALFMVPYIVMKDVQDYLQRTNPEDMKEQKHILTSGEVSIDQHITKNTSTILVTEQTNNNWVKTTPYKSRVVYYKNSLGNCLKAYFAGFGAFLIFPISIVGVIMVSFATLFTNIFF